MPNYDIYSMDYLIFPDRHVGLRRHQWRHNFHTGMTRRPLDSGHQTPADERLLLPDQAPAQNVSTVDGQASTGRDGHGQEGHGLDWQQWTGMSRLGTEWNGRSGRHRLGRM
jgi:hypothetical protein